MSVAVLVLSITVVILLYIIFSRHPTIPKSSSIATTSKELTKRSEKEPPSDRSFEEVEVIYRILENVPKNGHKEGAAPGGVEKTIRKRYFKGQKQSGPTLQTTSYIPSAEVPSSISKSCDNALDSKQIDMLVRDLEGDKQHNVTLPPSVNDERSLNQTINQQNPEISKQNLQQLDNVTKDKPQNPGSADQKPCKTPIALSSAYQSITEPPVWKPSVTALTGSRNNGDSQFSLTGTQSEDDSPPGTVHIWTPKPVESYTRTPSNYDNSSSTVEAIISDAQKAAERASQRFGEEIDKMEPCRFHAAYSQDLLNGSRNPKTKTHQIRQHLQSK